MRGLKRASNRPDWCRASPDRESQKTTNPREGIETLDSVPVVEHGLVGQKTTNPREGIETCICPVSNPAPSPRRQKTTNPREGIETQLFVNGFGF